MNIESLMKKIVKFGQDRGWNPVPQDIAKSVVIEACELLEHFQWDASSKEINIDINKKDLKEIKYEVADVFWYLINFCHTTGIDLAEAVELKMKHNEEKYPAEKFSGRHNHQFYLQQKKKYRAAKRST